MTKKDIAELKEASRENIEYMIEYIKKKLQVVNTGAISAKSFDTDQYEDLVDLYQFVTMKESFTMSEMESIVAELGKLRKK
jgi:uncharacterized protein YfkK (UPF0435 family)